MKNELGMDSSLLALFAVSIAMLLASCSKSEHDEASGVESVPSSVFDPNALELEDTKLITGREIWMRTCAQCHIRGLGGAPVIADKADWAPRIAKGKETLYEHAINGFVGPQLNEMPAKGGFLDLTDDEVKLAVDFVVFASQ